MQIVILGNAEVRSFRTNDIVTSFTRYDVKYKNRLRLTAKRNYTEKKLQRDKRNISYRQTADSYVNSYFSRYNRKGKNRTFSVFL